MNQHRNTAIRRRESKTAVFECQSRGEPSQLNSSAPQAWKETPRTEPSIVRDSAVLENQAGRAPTVVGRTPYDFIVENLGGLSAALAGFVRRIRPIVFLIVVAYVLLCI